MRALPEVAFTASAHASALESKASVARALTTLRGHTILIVLPIATAAAALIFWEAMARGSIRTAPPRETRFVPVMPDILPQCGERLPAESGKLA